MGLMMNSSRKALDSDVIFVRDLKKEFGNFVAVDRISFSVKRGEIFGFLGSNGSGKSTTIRMLCGILTPTSGFGIVGDHDIYKESEKVKEVIGYMSQKFSLYEDLTPVENIRFYLGIYMVPVHFWEERIDWVLNIFGLKEASNRPVKDLPPGWHQRLALGCALLHKPKILFLDEPTSGVDLITRHHFWDFIASLAENGTTIFATTHYMDEACFCQRIALIDKGEIIAMGSPSAIIRRAGLDPDQATFGDAFIKLVSGRAEKSRNV